MNKRLIVFILMGVLLIGSFSILILWLWPDNERRPEPRKQFYHITALGDSLTEGVGDEQGGGYTERTAKQLESRKDTSKVSIDNYGHRGDTSDALLETLKRSDVQESVRESNTIFVTIGGNDLAGVLRKHFLNLKVSDFNAQQQIYTENLRNIISRIRTMNDAAQIFVLGLYNPFEDYLGQANRDFAPILDQWNEEIARITNGYDHTQFVPTADLFKGKGDRLLFEDHFHPNQEGYSLIARRLIRYMDDLSQSNG